MKIIHVAPISLIRDTSKETASTYSQIGGLSNSVIKLAKGQSENQNRVAVITTRSSDQLVEEGVSWYSVCKKSIFNLLMQDPFNEIEGKLFIPDIIHTHDIFELKQLPIIFHALRRGYKVFISPRGTLSPVALSRKKIKKIAYIFLALRPLVRYIEGFAALNSGEKSHIRSKFPQKKIIIIGNGCDDKSRELNRYSYNYEKKSLDSIVNIGFMGRYEIHIKGLDLLLNAFVEFQKTEHVDNLKITMIGDHTIKEFDSNNFIERIRKSLTNNEMLELKGPLYNQEKWNEISKFDVFIHPSRTEGMPNAVLEALSMGIPCSVTPQTNVSEMIKEADCGWIINGNVRDIKDHLIYLSNIKKDFIAERGENALDYSRKKLLWKEIGSQDYDI